MLHIYGTCSMISRQDSARQPSLSVYPSGRALVQKDFTIHSLQAPDIPGIHRAILRNEKEELWKPGESFSPGVVSSHGQLKRLDPSRQSS